MTSSEKREWLLVTFWKAARETGFLYLLGAVPVCIALAVLLYYIA